MEKTLLIAGKELPDGSPFASGAVTSGRRTMITQNHSETEIAVPNGAISVTWNRPSALSARSLILKTLNEFSTLDECVILFDETYFLEKYGNLDSTAENIRIIEELISSYQYLTMEIITRVQKQIKNNQLNMTDEEKHPLRLVYLLKSNISLSESILEKSTSKPSSPFLSTATGAFKAYAENIAASLNENTEIQPLLVHCEFENELSKDDNKLSTWLFSYIETINALKRPLSTKQKLTWVKAGAKSPGGFFFS